MDNCGGQNKNRFVLRLAVLFVELEFYRRVNIIFLVAGHTKNAADRLFNLLKKEYRKKQVFTMTQLQDVLDQNSYVSCNKVGEDDFYNFGQFKDTVYKQTPLLGNTKKYQLFYSTNQEKGVLFGKSSNTDQQEHQMDLQKGTGEVRENILKFFNIDDVPKLVEKDHRIKWIKQVELYPKWRKHVPDKHKSPLCDNPGDDVLQSIKEDRKKKRIRPSAAFKPATG
jgi:flavodoxin